MAPVRDSPHSGGEMIEPFGFQGAIESTESLAYRNLMRNMEWIVNTYLFEQGVIAHKPDFPPLEGPAGKKRPKWLSDLLSE